jgi:hypothetical protein
MNHDCWVKQEFGPDGCKVYEVHFDAAYALRHGACDEVCACLWRIACRDVAAGMTWRRILLHVKAPSCPTWFFKCVLCMVAVHHCPVVLVHPMTEGWIWTLDDYSGVPDPISYARNLSEAYG